MTEILNKEFSRKSFLKGGGAMVVGFSLAGGGLAGTAVAAESPFASNGPGERESDDHRAAALDERLARELLVEHFGHDYFPPFAITAAAFWIAVRIRG